MKVTDTERKAILGILKALKKANVKGDKIKGGEDVLELAAKMLSYVFSREFTVAELKGKLNVMLGDIDMHIDEPTRQ